MRYIIISILIISAFFLGTIVVKSQTCWAFCNSNALTVNATEFNKMTSQNSIVILDVRTPEEYEAGHLKNAQNLDFYNTDVFQDSLNSLDKNKTYLIYCRSGNRSSKAMKIMEEKGFAHLVNLQGGIQEWETAGFTVER